MFLTEDIPVAVSVTKSSNTQSFAITFYQVCEQRVWCGVGWLAFLFFYIFFINIYHVCVYVCDCVYTCACMCMFGGGADVDKFVYVLLTLCVLISVMNFIA